MMRVLARIRAEPWAITQETMATILEIAARENQSPEAVAAQLGRPLENTYDVEIRDGVAILSVSGPMFRYANLFTALSGATSYDLLARDFAAAISNPRVNSVLLNIDSPGGEANGVSEFADMIYNARGTKPIVAYGGGSVASAAYWIASAADEIVIDDTAILGSIGVVLGVEDSRARDEKNGIKRMEIVSAASPYKRVDPATDDGRSRLQSRVDALSDVFLAKVARNRGVSVETVAKEFGQGDVFVGLAAVNAGLADRVGSYEGVISQLQARSNNPGAYAAAGGKTLEHDMSDNKSPAVETKPDSLTAAQVAEQQPTAVAAIRTEAKAGGVEEGRTAERARIKAILGSEAAEGRTELAHFLAFDGDTAAEAAVAMLGKAAKTEASKTGFEKLDAAMKGAGNANLGANEEPDGGKPKDPGDALVATAKLLGLA